MRPAVKWPLVGAIVLLGLVGLWGVALWSITHSVDVEELPEVVVSEAVAPDDDSFAQLNARAQPLGRALGDTICGAPHTVDIDYRSNVCGEQVREHREALIALSETLASIAPGAEPQTRARIEWPEGLTADPPDMMGAMRAARLLSVASVQSFANDDAEAGVAFLGAVFDMGSWFVGGAPSLLPMMIGIAVHSMGLSVISDYLDSQTLTAVDPVELQAMLPDDDELREGLRFAIGGEWRSMMFFLEHELETNAGPFSEVQFGAGAPADVEPSGISWTTAKRFGIYDPQHTRFMMTRRFAQLQARVDDEKLGVDWGPESPPGWDEMGWTKWIHNPVGRLLESIGVPSFDRFVSKTGRAIDRVEAIRAVLAVRRFHGERQRWPQAAEDLMPSYLEQWPTSALDGAALRWEEGGIRLLDDEGRELCSAADCRVPFSAPRPAGGEPEEPPPPASPHH